MKLKFSHLLLVGTGLAVTAFVADPPKKHMKFIDPANMDLSVKPGDNFFEYANGTWIKTHPIPDKQTRWGSFGILGQENTDKIQLLVKEAAKNPGVKGSLKQRVGDLYASGMDSVTIDKRGYEPIKPDLERIHKIESLDGVIAEMTYDRSHSIADPLYGVGVRQDSKHPTKYIVGFNQGGTTLADRDYYLVNNPRNQRIVTAYKKYITTLFKLTGRTDDVAAKNANTI